MQSGTVNCICHTKQGSLYHLKKSQKNLDATSSDESKEKLWHQTFLENLVSIA